jgi:subtilisin family serine protease
MGYLSKRLQDYLASGYLSEAAPVMVVVKVNQPPADTIRRVPRTARARSMALEVLRTAGLRLNKAITDSPTFQPGQTIEGFDAITLQVPARDLSALANSPGVEYIRPARLHRMHLHESAALLGLGAGGNAPFDGAGIRVAIIDSGIDHNHPDLRGRVNTGLSRNFTDEGTSSDVTDETGHGTHVAGIIGGSGSKYKGVAPGVEFVACKVFNSRGTTTSELAIISAVRWAVQKGAHVINYSGGFAPVVNHPTLGQVVLVEPPWVWPEQLLEEEAEFKYAMDSGVVAVVSAGNEGELGKRGTLSMPATSPAVISVGSIGKDRRLSGFSSTGPCYRSRRVSPADAPESLSRSLRPDTRSFAELDLVAPGGEVDLIAARSGGCYHLPGIISALSSSAKSEPACVVEEHYVRMSGTSQAAPHVAGLAALAMQAVNTLGIDFGPRRAYAIKKLLRASAEALPYRGVSEQGRGLPRWAALEQLLQDLAAGRVPVSRFLR